MRNVFLCLVFLLAAPDAFAGDPDKPAEIGAYVKADKEYGAGSVTFAFMRIYDATLWTDAKPFSWDKPFALRLLYRRNLSSKGLVDKTLELMNNMDHTAPEKLRQYGDQLSKLWPDVKDGDTITAIYQPGGKTIFYFDHTLKGSIDDPAFGRPFFDIWLSDKTSEPAARKGLLAGNT